MDKEFARKALIVAAVLLILPFSVAWALNRSAYEADKSRIEQAYDTERAACDAPEHNARRACIEQARLRQKLALAELEHAFTGREADRIQLVRTRAEADLFQSRLPCEDQAGNDGAAQRCLVTARADSDRS